MITHRAGTHHAVTHHDLNAVALRAFIFHSFSMTSIICHAELISDVVRGAVRGAARPRGLLERPHGRAASPPPHPWIRGADPGHGGLGGGGKILI